MIHIANMIKSIIYFTVLFQVVAISVYGLSIAEKWTRLNGMGCSSFRAQSAALQYFELNSVVDAKPRGYKVYLQFPIVAKKTAGIILDSERNHQTSPDYYRIDFYKKFILLERNGVSIAYVRLSSSELMDVVIAITNDNILAVTVDGKLLITHYEINPFVINYFGFSPSKRDDAQFFYNCKSTSNNGATASSDTLIGDIARAVEIESRAFPEFKERGCSSFRTQSNSFETFELNSVVDAKPSGYKLYFQLSLIPRQTARILLKSARVSSLALDYRIVFDSRENSIWARRADKTIASFRLSPSDVMDVLIAITNDNILTVTVDGKTLVTYNEADPFVINYFGFSTSNLGDEARFFFNCRSEHNLPTGMVAEIGGFTTERTEQRQEQAKEKDTMQCGTRQVNRQPLIISGFRTKEGDWPWHVAIYHHQHERRSFACGGTLITSDAVITAAHCLYELDHPLDPRRVIVSLGKHDLQLAGGHTQEFRALQLIIHDGYVRSTFQNDIAIIRLSTVVRFTPYVQPICLWDARQTALEEIIGRNGVVVGWGLNKYDKLEALDQAFMPVVSFSDCLTSDQEFFGSSIFLGTYCAGFRNGTIVCNGDSGGGMYFFENGSYTLRGIVSRTKARSGADNLCDTQSYVIFTDTANFLQWIQENTK